MHYTYIGPKTINLIIIVAVLFVKHLFLHVFCMYSYDTSVYTWTLHDFCFIFSLLYYSSRTVFFGQYMYIL